jgi:4-hydroxy-4-methyl-2-oxoglutarate aldolase
MSDGNLFARLAAIDTTCLADAGPDLGVLPTDLCPIGRSRRLVGRALTVDARSDLMSTIAAIKASGPGDVLVISAGDDDRAAAGELFATEAQRRGVAGIVIDGRSRDSAVVGKLDIAVFSRGPAPNAPGARKLPRIQVPITIGDVEIQPGDIVLGDGDGIVVGPTAAIEAALEKAEAIQARERRLQAAIQAGRSLFEALNFDEHLAALEAGRPSRLVIGEMPEGEQR